MRASSTQVASFLLRWAIPPLFSTQLSDCTPGLLSAELKFSTAIYMITMLYEEMHAINQITNMARMKLHLSCAACRMLHRKCDKECLLAPYFPAEAADKFAIVHRVFGASNIIKMLQAVKEGTKEDAIKSMVYEAHARLQDPIYGCTGVILYLQRCVEDLQGQLRTIQEQVLESQMERDQLLSYLMDASEFNPFLYADFTR